MLTHLRQDTARLRMLKTKKAPWYVIESLLFENGYQAVVLHRIAHWFKSRGIPLFGPLFARISLFLTGVDIAPGAQVGPGLLISHGVGLVIGGHARIGAGALLLHQVTIGSPSHGRVEEMPTIGDNVFIGAGAKIIGGIQVGNDVVIGVNCVVTEDIPSDSRVRSTSGLIIRQVAAQQSPPPDEDPLRSPES
ncbi:MAG: serine O-acetyltransferase [Deltaproteobacteria bacterium]|nr:serine O-acetyltransferase [Deltaproteobacteria bacterium]